MTTDATLWVKGFFILLTVLLPAVLTPPAVAEWKYHNDASGYSLTLPDDWVRIPDETVKQLEAASGPTPDKQTHYDAAFQRKDSPPMTLPLIVLQSVPGMVPESKFTEFVSGITKGIDTSIHERDDEMARKGLNSPGKQPVVLDAAHQSFSYGMTINGPGGSVRVMSFGRFGGQSTVQVMYTDTAEHIDKSAAARDAIFASIQYDSGREFKHGQGETGFFDFSDPEKSGESIGRVIGAVVIGGGLLWVLLSRKKPKAPVPPTSQNPPPPG